MVSGSRSLHPGERLPQVFAFYEPNSARQLRRIAHADRTIDGLSQNLQGLIVSGEPYLESQILSQRCKYGLARISHHLTVEARDKLAITSLRLLVVLNVLFKYASARRAARALY